MWGTETGFAKMFELKNPTNPIRSDPGSVWIRNSALNSTFKGAVSRGGLAFDDMYG
jgi:hypothetical protein